MQDERWTEARMIMALEKSGRTTLLLSSKSRRKIQRALLEENMRLRAHDKPARKSRRNITELLSSLSNY